MSNIHLVFEIIALLMLYIVNIKMVAIFYYKLRI
jgi:hypothetical protein